MEKFVAKFVVDKRLAAGGWGVVYSAKPREGGPKLALKLMDKNQVCSTQRGVNQLQSELKYLKLARGNPWVTELVFSRSFESSIVIGMEFCAGGDLFTMMQTMGTFSESLLRSVSAEIIYGVNQLHKMCIIHRDLKAENILLDRHGHVKIADLGFAKRLGPGELTNESPGTWDYVSLKRVLSEIYLLFYLF